MKRIFFVIALFVLGLTSFPAAAEDDFKTEYVRQESLEIPGLTAGCHVCEWRPKLNTKPAAEQCGLNDAGEPVIGLFECGFAQDCERVCNLLSCGES